MTRVLSLLAVTVVIGCGSPAPAAAPARTSPRPVESAAQTAAVGNNPDDPAIWIHPTDPSRSLILGTDKIESTGGLYVFGLDGALRQSIVPLDRPEQRRCRVWLPSGTEDIDIAVVTERMRHRLRVFQISAESGVSDIAPDGLPVLVGMSGESAEPMGIALYKRRRDGAVFAIVAPKTGGTKDYLWQYRLDSDRAGRLSAVLVRRFGHFSQAGAGPDDVGEIEAVVVDDALGYVYYSDELYGIRKYYADPDHDAAGQELAVFGTTDYVGDREGLAIYETGEVPDFSCRAIKRKRAPG